MYTQLYIHVSGAGCPRSPGGGRKASAGERGLLSGRAGGRAGGIIILVPNVDVWVGFWVGERASCQRVGEGIQPALQAASQAGVQPARQAQPGTARQAGSCGFVF